MQFNRNKTMTPFLYDAFFINDGDHCFPSILFIQNRVKSKTSTIVFYGERKILPGAESSSTLLRAQTYRKGERRGLVADPISLLPPDIASAPRPFAPWLYERSERRLAPLEDIDVAAGQTFLFRNPSPVNRGSQDSFVRAIALAEGRTWEEAYQDLCRQALSQCDNPQSTSVAASYLSRYAVGTCQYFTRGKPPVKEFLASHPSGAWVLQLDKGWASAVVDGGADGYEKLYQ